MFDIKFIISTFRSSNLWVPGTGCNGTPCRQVFFLNNLNFLTKFTFSEAQVWLDEIVDLPEGRQIVDHPVWQWRRAGYSRNRHRSSRVLRSSLDKADLHCKNHLFSSVPPAAISSWFQQLPSEWPLRFRLTSLRTLLMASSVLHSSLWLLTTSFLLSSMPSIRVYINSIN